MVTLNISFASDTGQSSIEKKKGMEPIELLYPDVNRNGPIRKEKNAWYGEKQPIIIGSPVSDVDSKILS